MTRVPVVQFEGINPKLLGLNIKLGAQSHSYREFSDRKNITVGH
jgi:hypothetical protein